jgi:hypothetical protein
MKLIHIYIFILFISTNVFSFVYKDVKMPDSLDINGKKFEVVTYGLRTATWLKIHVYVMGVYAESKKISTSDFLDPIKPKVFVFSFKRDVPKEKSKEAWYEVFEETDSKNFQSFKKHIDEFVGFFGDLKKNDVMEVLVKDNGFSVKKNGKELGSINDKILIEAYLKVWIGKDAPVEKIKKELT